ncbi:Na(+)/H(+) antiporter subunit C [Skermania piniformis]|uniref:Na(+)/H(+) antiporter subunit C n=1 Tax=Skermania pinensis TaxID=39122 RepID=A0ABX8S8W5_9ACTN|nr:Na(+)/H(+) antiporter subunit C [Skermania piniformis]QXQ14279.1 Na(+)/H(+) antiporter subunit C [Skermania piniformis]
MSIDATLLILVGMLLAVGVYLILERSIITMLLGIIACGNGVNLLIIAVGGRAGAPPIVGRGAEPAQMADPLAQAMILTAIVITMGLSAFVLALAYRSYTLTGRDGVDDDPEDVRVATQWSRADAPDQDLSDDPVTGAPSPEGDAFDAQGNPLPLDELPDPEDVECYDELHGESR